MALVLALVGDNAKSQSLAENLAKSFPEDTTVRFNYLSTLHAQLALNRGDTAGANDPNFAMAYGGLFAAYADLGESNLAQENAKKAYELRGEISERERSGIEAIYYWGVAGDLEKARDAYELLVRTYPRDSGAHFNLGNVYQGLGQLEEGLAQARETFRLKPNSSDDGFEFVGERPISSHKFDYTLLTHFVQSRQDRGL